MCASDEAEVGGCVGCLLSDHIVEGGGIGRVIGEEGAIFGVFLIVRLENKIWWRSEVDVSTSLVVGRVQRTDTTLRNRCSFQELPLGCGLSLIQVHLYMLAQVHRCMLAVLPLGIRFPGGERRRRWKLYHLDRGGSYPFGICLELPW